MNWLDLVLIVVLAIFTLIGLRTGIIKAILSLAGIIVGVILAGNYYLPLSERLTFIPHTGAARIVAFAIILIGIMVIAAVLARFLKWATSLILLGWVNRLGGAVFGFVLAGILYGAALAAWLKFFGSTSTITESGLANILLDRLPLVLALLPKEFDSISSFFY
jgi:membrane protein required for colicin V production